MSGFTTFGLHKKGAWPPRSHFLSLLGCILHTLFTGNYSTTATGLSLIHD